MFGLDSATLAVGGIALLAPALFYGVPWAWRAARGNASKSDTKFNANLGHVDALIADNKDDPELVRLATQIGRRIMDREYPAVPTGGAA